MYCIFVAETDNSETPIMILKINRLQIMKKSGNGSCYLTSRCAGGCGNTTYTPEAGGTDYNFRTPLEN